VGIVTDLTAPDPLFALSVSVFKASSDTGAATMVGTTPDYFALGPNVGLPGTYVVESTAATWARIEVNAVNSAGSNVFGRAAVFEIEPGSVGFIRLGLVSSCMNVPCLSNQTCIEGQCLSPLIEADVVPYESADQNMVDCAGPGSSTMIDTRSNRPMTVRGSCPARTTCIEGSCR
jgi:hypothetical protein